MFTDPFMQRALLAALILGPLCALLGVFVTARKMAFFSDTISHAALAGIALGFWAGLQEPTIPMLIFSLVIAAAMLWLKERTDLPTDTIMALLLSGSVAFGIIVLSLLEGFRSELHRYLFGDILAVSPNEIMLAALLLAAVLVWLFFDLNGLTLITAQEDIAHVCGIRVRAQNYVFVVMLTFTVALSIRLLGIVLVTSLLVIPPAVARNLSRSLRQQILFSVIAGLLGSLVGIVVAGRLDVPCGATIVMACIAEFLVSVPLGWWLSRSAVSTA